MNVLVTGASSGFGKSICQILVEKGHKVVGFARRRDKLDALKAQLGDNFMPVVCDVCDFASIDTAFSALKLDKIDVLVNNAGLALGLEPMQSLAVQDWTTMINTNINGLVYFTQKVLPQMVTQQSGLVINMGSIAGSYPYPGGNIYGATKAFVKQFSLNLRADLIGTGVRVTNIEPGLCSDTEFSNIRFKGDDEKAAKVYDNVEAIKPDDIANTVAWLVEQPAHVNFNRIEMMPVAQASGPLAVHRGE
ncbi:SDR family NAD(P)-dependent oxidoreductase [Celerinatantimonas yamalensis]|uniref:SDR family NAD(P)-dependent oxidoreductase n=1 Tax=Celerinatantimonas yamalensis TaxID=559956 RepID=A0ABW9G1X7_9GAMM